MQSTPLLRALVADDDRLINDMICLWLKDILVPSIEPIPAYTYETTRNLIERGKPDIIILDRNLGDGDGAVLLRRIRENPTTSAVPVVILSGHAREREVIDGLTRGADDYITKPCTSELFRARLLAVLRRNRPTSNRSPLIDGPGFKLDPVDGRLLVEGRVEHLEPKETEILLLLLRRPNVVHSAEFIRNEVWCQSEIPHNSLESRLSSLRRKLGEKSTCLETVRGAGIRYGAWGFDYAAVPSGELGAAHRFTLAVKW